MTHSPHHPQTAIGGSGHAWPAILALTQANRDTAAALLLAMQAFGDPSGCAMQPDEVHCWYTDAHDAADVASQAADTLKLLTTNASTVLATTGAAPANHAAPLATAYHAGTLAQAIHARPLAPANHAAVKGIPRFCLPSGPHASICTNV